MQILLTSLLLINSFFVFSQKDSTALVFQKNQLAISISTGFVDLSPTVQMALSPDFPQNTGLVHNFGFNANVTLSVHSKINMGFEYGYGRYLVKYPSIYGFVSHVKVDNYRLTPYFSFKMGESKPSKIVYFSSFGVGLRLTKAENILNKRTIEEVFPIIYLKMGMYKQISPKVRLFFQIGTGAPLASFGLNF
jgi:hypothetical protein